jgi:hypothetical protein
LYKNLLVLNLLFDGFELILFLVGWIGEGGFPCDWVWDIFGEVISVKGAFSWYVDVVDNAVGGTQVFPECGKAFIFNF